MYRRIGRRPPPSSSEPDLIITDDYSASEASAAAKPAAKQSGDYEAARGGARDQQRATDALARLSAGERAV